MKIAIFSDVHGNLPALEKFLSMVNGKVDGYLCLGDVVNYGPWSNECLELVLNLPNLSIVRGNHEDLFIDSAHLKNEVELVRKFTEVAKKYFTRADLIVNIPFETKIETFTATHTINNARIYPDTEIILNGNYIIGHSHHQFTMHNNGFTLVNPGSIGQNRLEINIANHSILDTRQLQFSFHRVKFDIDYVIQTMVKLNYPIECVNYYLKKNRGC